MSNTITPRGGSLNPNARLTPLQVAAIRARTNSAKEAAQEHGISRSMVNAIRQGRRWVEATAVGVAVTMLTWAGLFAWIGVTA